MKSVRILNNTSGASSQMLLNLHNTYSHVWSAVDGADDPGISGTRSSKLTSLASLCNVKDLGVRQIGAIGTRLVPSLNGGTDGSHEDGKVERFRVSPAVLGLDPQDLVVLGRELRDRSRCVRRTGNEGTLLEGLQFVNQVVLGTECFDIGYQFVFGFGCQRVRDPNLRLARFCSSNLVIRLYLLAGCLMRRIVIGRWCCVVYMIQCKLFGRTIILVSDMFFNRHMADATNLSTRWAS
jgi:hypothetical protein